MTEHTVAVAQVLATVLQVRQDILQPRPTLRVVEHIQRAYILGLDAEQGLGYSIGYELCLWRKLSTVLCKRHLVMLLRMGAALRMHELSRVRLFRIRLKKVLVLVII